MGRSGAGRAGGDKLASYGRRRHSPMRRRCPDCGIGEHSYHERGCAWALENDPASIKTLELKDLVGRTLTVTGADDDSFQFTVNGAEGEVYEVGEHEFSDYYEGGITSYTRFDFTRVEPRSSFSTPRLPLLPDE